MIRLNAVEVELRQKLKNWAEGGKLEIDGPHQVKDVSLSCPAASGSHGERVFATYLDADDELDFLSVAVELPEVLVINHEMSDFSLRNRLEGKCLTTACQHWQGACRLGFFVSKIEVQPRRKEINCAISKSCRWLKENGERVCGACSFTRNFPLIELF